MKRKTERLALYAPLTSKTYKLLKKRTKIILSILLLLFTGFMLFAGYQAFINTSDVPRNRDVTRYQDILTEEEQKEWKTKNIQKGEVVFQLNMEIPVDAKTGYADIRLVHPPYSDFVCRVVLTDLESGIVLYESEEMIPGTIIQYALLSESMAVGKYDAIVSYTFLDGKEKVHGTYDVEVVLDVKEEDEKDKIIDPYDDVRESESQ